jgi:ABC-2 type transport system ATP-binding protein
MGGAMPGASKKPTGSGQFRLYTADEPAVVLPAVLKVLGDVGCDVTDLAIGTPSLEDVFIHLTGRTLR